MDVTPVLFLVRWIRLLLAREFPLEGVFFLWDRLFIRTKQNFPILDYCCAAILLLKKESILQCSSTADLLNEMQIGLKTMNICVIWRLSILFWEVVLIVSYY